MDDRILSAVLCVLLLMLVVQTVMINVSFAEESGQGNAVTGKVITKVNPQPEHVTGRVSVTVKEGST